MGSPDKSTITSDDWFTWSSWQVSSGQGGRWYNLIVQILVRTGLIIVVKDFLPRVSNGWKMEEVDKQHNSPSRYWPRLLWSTEIPPIKMLSWLSSLWTSQLDSHSMFKTWNSSTKMLLIGSENLPTWILFCRMHSFHHLHTMASSRRLTMMLKTFL